MFYIVSPGRTTTKVLDLAMAVLTSNFWELFFHVFFQTNVTKLTSR